MRPVGDHAALLELADNASVHIAARLARERYGDQLVDVVPGHETLLISWHAGSVMNDFSELAAAVASSESPKDDGPGSPEAIKVPVVYDGADLESVATSLGTSSEAVVGLHSEATYAVAFTGFAPGFPYLVAEQPSAVAVAQLLELPRLETPRAAVPAGSVAVAAGYCGIYPRSSPGGWNLIGTTDVVLFDPEREPPALLEPGVRVRFEAS